MSLKDCNILCWNARGLNDGAKRASVRNQISSSGATLVCLQETKITTWTSSLLLDTVGTGMAQNAAFLPNLEKGTTYCKGTKKLEAQAIQ